MKRSPWTLISLLCILLSVASLFVSVVIYRVPDNPKSYAIQDMIDGETFTKEVMDQFQGKVLMQIDSWVLSVLCVLAALAILAALIGVIILSKQKPTTWPYVMTMIGLVGTAIPSVLLFILCLMSDDYFPHPITCGFYPIVTPIAMVISMITVTLERRRVKKAHMLQQRNSALIRPAGDL